MDVTKNELNSCMFFQFSSEETAYYEDKYPFGEDVFNAFSNSVFDVEEASKSMALERYTASVFHCMRVVEEGLNSIAKPLGIQVEILPSWDSIMKKIGQALDKKHGTEKG